MLKNDVKESRINSERRNKSIKDGFLSGVSLESLYAEYGDIVVRKVLLEYKLINKYFTVNDEKDETKRKKVIRLFISGMSQVDIIKATNYSRSVVQKIIYKYKAGFYNKDGHRTNN